MKILQKFVLPAVMKLAEKNQYHIYKRNSNNGNVIWGKYKSFKRKSSVKTAFTKMIGYKWRSLDKRYKI